MNPSSKLRLKLRCLKALGYEININSSCVTSLNPYKESSYNMANREVDNIEWFVMESWSIEERESERLGGQKELVVGIVCLSLLANLSIVGYFAILPDNTIAHPFTITKQIPPTCHANENVCSGGIVKWVISFDHSSRPPHGLMSRSSPDFIWFSSRHGLMSRSTWHFVWFSGKDMRERDRSLSRHCGTWHACVTVLRGATLLKIKVQYTWQAPIRPSSMSKNYNK